MYPREDIPAHYKSQSVRKQASLSAVLNHPATLPIAGALAGATGGGLLSKHLLGKYWPGIAAGGAIGAGLPIGVRHLLQKRTGRNAAEDAEQDELAGIYDEYDESGKPVARLRTYLEQRRAEIDKMPAGEVRDAALRDWEQTVQNAAARQVPLREAYGAMAEHGLAKTRLMLDDELRRIVTMPRGEEKSRLLDAWHRKDVAFERTKLPPATLEDPRVAQYKLEAMRNLLRLLQGTRAREIPVADELRAEYPEYAFPDMTGTAPVELPGGSPLNVMRGLSTGRTELPLVTRAALKLMQRYYPETVKGVTDLSDVMADAHKLLFDPTGRHIHGLPAPGGAEEWRTPGALNTALGLE